MEPEKGNYFLRMIKHLRQQEEVMLYGNIVTVPATEEADVVSFLKAEYGNEVLEYPGTAPAFNSDAALWSAKVVYLSAQLLLYRNNKVTDLPQLLPVYGHVADSGAWLSADLCLRFLPDMLTQLKLIDSEDTLISLLEAYLQQWHYSGVGYSLAVDQLDFTLVQSDPCLFQMYCDRIFEHRKLELARHPVFGKSIAAQLGIYGTSFWKDFPLTSTTLSAS